MTSTTEVTELDEIYFCQICFNPYDVSFRIPMLLRECQHTVCAVCLPGMAKSTTDSPKSVITCPYCNYNYQLELNQVPKNQVYLKILRATNGDQNSLLNTFNTAQSLIMPKVDIDKKTNSLPVAFQQLDVNDLINRFDPNPKVPPKPSKTVTNWSEANYLHDLFNNVDVNGDGTITFIELHQALICGQPNSQFDTKTVKVLINKFDTNNDGEINFNEFEKLFNYLNDEYLKFVLADIDASQTIDGEELKAFLEERNFKFTQNFYDFLINSIKTHSSNGVTFDYYCRLMARFDYLTKLYENQSYLNTLPLENYLEDVFFHDFW